MILELIDRRYSDKLKTLITTNLNQKGLKEDLGQRIFSRLFDQKNAILDYWVGDRRQYSEYME
jgi:DNA replication protein DnaC